MATPCPQPNPECKYYGTPECIVTVHHQFWPSPDYTTKTERFFREMNVNKERLPRCDHDELHQTQEPPEKPSYDFMRGFILASEVHIPSSLRKQLRLGQ